MSALLSCTEYLWYLIEQLRYNGKVEQKEIPASTPKEVISQIPFKKHSLILFVCDAMDLPVLFHYCYYFVGQYYSSSQ